MKKIAIVLSVLSLAAGLASCSKVEFTERQFSSFQTSSYTVSEDAGTLTIPVKVKSNGETSVAFKVNEGTATLGDFFNLVTTGGVINFPENSVVDAQGYRTGNIVFSIVDRAGEYTGNTKFTVELTSATNGVQLGSAKKVTVNIKDNDHPLLSLFGEYTFKSVQLYESSTKQYTYYSYKPTISAYEGDVTRVWIDQLFSLQRWYGSYMTNNAGKCYAIVSADKSTISIPVPQDFNTNLDNLFGSGAGNAWIYKCNGLVFSPDKGEIVFKLQPDGSYITTDDFGLNTPEYLAESPGDWFYYGMNVFSTLYPSAPSVLKKN